MGKGVGSSTTVQVRAGEGGSSPSPVAHRPSPPLSHHDKILILDFGAQYTQLIARRIREFGVYCEIWAWDHDPAEIAAWGAKGIILSGGPESTTLAGAPRAQPLRASPCQDGGWCLSRPLLRSLHVEHP